MSEESGAFVRLATLVGANDGLFYPENPDLNRVLDCLGVWAGKVVPIYGFKDERTANILHVLFQATYCLGYAAGKKATMLSNWQVAGEDKE